MKKALIAAVVAAIMVAAAVVIPTRITAKAAANPPAPSAAAQRGPKGRDKDNDSRTPHMTAAIKYLEQAKAELEQAHPDFAGYRIRALESTNTALKECHDGLESLKKK